MDARAIFMDFAGGGRGVQGDLRPPYPLVSFILFSYFIFSYFTSLYMYSPLLLVPFPFLLIPLVLSLLPILLTYRTALLARPSNWDLFLKYIFSEKSVCVW